MSLNIGILESSRSGGAFDADAQAFFNRVTAAGGTLSATEQTAVNTLVVSLKSFGIWTLMKAIYPMVGATNASCRQNLKSSSFTGSFSGGWTFTSNGATPNGTTGFMNTQLVPLTEGLTTANAHLSYYPRTAATTADPAEIGAFLSTTRAIILQSKSSGLLNRYFYTLSLSASRAVVTAPTGFMMGSSIANTRRDLYFNGLSVANNTSTDNGDLSNLQIYIGAANTNVGAQSPTNSQCAFASIGNGLTSTQALNLYTSVQAFQTTLSRQV
jgi:hypothetical protein